MPKASSSSAAQRNRSVTDDLDLDLQLSGRESVDDGAPSPKTAALLRRRKNADAQAAFRARRANYIANLEETVTSLEGAVRRLQDACRDARDESQELREENKRLLAIIENAKLDAAQRWPSDGLHPNYPSTSASTSLRSSPNHGPEFALAYATSGVVPSTPSNPQMREDQQRPRPRDVFRPNDGDNVDPDVFPPYANFASNRASTDMDHDSPWMNNAFGPQPAMNVVNNPNDFLSAGEAPPQFDFSARSVSPLVSGSPAMFDDGVSDHSRSLSPSVSGETAALSMPFNNLSIFGAQLPVDYGHAAESSNGPAPWDPAFFSPSPGFQLPSNGASSNSATAAETAETDLGRSDTVKASHYANQNALAAASAANRPTSRASQHQRSFSGAAEFDPQMAYLDESAKYDVDAYDHYAAHSRPSSSSSSLFSHGADHAPLQRHVTPSRLLNRSKSSRRHSFPVSMPSDSSEDQDMEQDDYTEVSDAAASGHGADPAAPMSNTLAVIKAQAFGTIRKSRVRTKRAGADSAAKVAMEVLQARGHGLGLDVDLDAGVVPRQRRRYRREEQSS